MRPIFRLSNSRSFLAIVVWFCLCSPARPQGIGQAQIRAISSATKQQLLRAQAHLDNAQWTDAVDTIRTLTVAPSSDRNRLVVVESDVAGFRYGISLHQHLNDILLSLPSQQQEVIVELRQRIDSAAADLLKAGESNQDTTSLRTIVDSYLVSSSGDDALLRLGDVQLDRGNYATARGYWSMISDRLHSGSRTRVLHIPDSDIPLAEVQARLVIASILEEDYVRAERELSHLAQKFPGSRGVLGGVEVDLENSLRELFESSRSSDTDTSDPGYDWPTYAANVERNIVSEITVDPTFEPQWRIALPTSAPTTNALGTASSRSLAVSWLPYEPIVIDEVVLYCDRSSVYARSVDTGNPVAWSDNAIGEVFSVGSEDSPSAFGQRLPFAMSAAKHRAIALLDDASRSTIQSLVGFDIADEGRLLFTTPARQLAARNEASWVFAGPAMTVGERYFVAMRSTSGIPEVAVSCFNGVEPSWQTTICSAEDYADSFDPQIVLAHAEDTVFAVTHTGTIAAMEARNGQLKWITSYPRSNTLTTNLLDRPWFRMRFRSPLVIHRGTAYVAPADYDGLIALDAFSGKLLWTTEHLSDSFDVTQIVGITDHHVIASGRRLWWIDVKTGRLSKIVQDNPFPREVQSELRGHGRGLISGGQVLWPTRDDSGEDRIYVFDAETGQMFRQPIQLTAAGVNAGNLITAAGYLLIASENELVAFYIGHRTVSTSQKSKSTTETTTR